MAYHSVDLKHCQDFLHKVPKLLDAHPGWTRIYGDVADLVDYFFEETTITSSALGRDVLERGAATLFSDAPEEWEYQGMVFGNQPTEHVGCKFIAAQNVTSYSVQAWNNLTGTSPGWELQSSADGITWTTVDNQSGLVWAEDEVKTFTVTGGAAALYWRITAVEPGSSGVSSGLAKVKFFGGSAELTLTSPTYVYRYQGFGNGDDNYISISMNQEQDDDEYAIRFEKFMTWDPSTRPISQYQSVSTFLNIRNTAMQLHLSINERRICGGVHLGGLDATFYAGCFLPYATPVEYPYPYFLAASYSSRLPAANISNGTIVARSYGTRIRDFTGVWIDIGYVSSSSYGRDSAEPFNLVPSPIGGWSMNNSSWQLKRPISGVHTLFPMTIVGRSGSTGWDTNQWSNYALGQLEGMYMVPGDGLVSGSTFSDADGNNYRVFQNYGKTEPDDYLALRLN